MYRARELRGPVQTTLIKMRIRPDSPTIDLRAGEKPSGEPVHEEIPVQPLGGRQFRLLASPTLALGVAAGDQVEMDDQGGYSILRRGSNVVVHVYADEKLDHASLIVEVNGLGGVLDGRADAPPDAFVSTFTIPSRAGFAQIEQVFTRYAAAHPTVRWSYGNVYDARGKPLNWWLK